MDDWNILFLPAMEGSELLLHLQFHQQFVKSEIKRIYVIANFDFELCKIFKFQTIYNEGIRYLPYHLILIAVL